jgi:hypothetical protein
MSFVFIGKEPELVGFTLFFGGVCARVSPAQYWTY